MGYTTHADCDLIGLGVSAISQVADSYCQSPRELPAWEAMIDEGRLPVWRGLDMDADDRLRAHVIQQLMCQAQVWMAAVGERFGIEFADYFRNDLRAPAGGVPTGLVDIG